MEVSRRTRSEAKKNKLDLEEMAMAELMLAGWPQKDAFCVCFKPAGTMPADYIVQRIQNICDSEPFIMYMRRREKIKRKGNSEEPEVEEEIEMLDKEEVLRELLRSARSLPNGSKERAEILMKYADLQQMKKDKVEGEDTTVHYYLPLTCHMCELHEKHKKALQNRL